MFLLLQTNHIHRIHTHTILHNFKMQVETCAVAGAAYIPNNLPCRYRFTCGNGSLRHVGIARGKSRTVIQQNLVAVAVVPAGIMTVPLWAARIGVPSGAGMSVPRCPELP